MQIAIDSSALRKGHSVRGIGVMVGELISYLEKEAKRHNGLEIKALDFDKSDLSKYDIVHYFYFFPYSQTLPSQKSGKKEIVTIQDLINLVYPKIYSPGIRGYLNFHKQKRRLKKVNGIITISETSKKDIVRFLGISSKKVKVIYLAPKKIFKIIKRSSKRLEEVRKKYHLPKKFVLYVGDVNYNKNIPSLISACKIAKLPLVIVGKQAGEIGAQGTDITSIRGPRDWLRFLLGKPHPELAHYSGLVRQFKSNKNIFRLGYISDEDLVTLYNLATVYCQPSFYEGFGLPVLEAMACGTPTVISRTNALVEIAGGASLIANPKDPKDIARKLVKVIGDSSTRKDLVKKGKVRVKEFSWKETANQTIEYYKFISEDKS
jgi:glycosyltransferase involved in cell wall biosynthesis